ncbi:MAG: lipoyl(octanoyl) transferase LipB [Deltaproteobacteria bacterium]|nr:lipoyl(octanoyl) transferase LipB [Deltaproteobacteria bacterium]
MRSLEVISFISETPTPYEQVWEFQKKRVDEIAAGHASECLIFCEHPLTITSGRRAVKENIIDPLAPVFEIERGGDVTLHSKGQLVIYPLVKLHGENFPGGLSEYLRFCEQALINILQSFGLETGRFGPTGVWIKDLQGRTKKIASIGIAVRRWITYHGIAINISNDLNEFQKIRPCNFDSSVMTSLTEQGVQISLKEFAQLIEDEFRGRDAKVPGQLSNLRN